MIAVIADDITGAAEIAGIGFRYGLSVSLLTDKSRVLSPCDLLVYATDTRSMTEAEAVAETRTVAAYLHEQPGVGRIFKKTDSALRGHVEAELRALMDVLGLSRTLFLPENPSKGRTVKDGIYRIGGQPLNETSFAFDPEFPARCADVTGYYSDVFSLRLDEAMSSEGICLADAESKADVVAQLRKADADCLVTGAADLFEACLEAEEFVLRPHVPFAGLGMRRALVVCGSTASRALDEYPYVRRMKMATESMPSDVFEGASPTTWYARLQQVYRTDGSLIMTIGHPSKGGKAFALRLRSVMARGVAELVKELPPEELVIEGGATAYSVLSALGWKQYRLVDEVAPGVVRLAYDGLGAAPVFITLKPGSYPWGDLFR